MESIVDTWKTCAAIVAIAAAASAQAIGTHGTNWARVQAASTEVEGQGSWSVEMQEGNGLWASTKGDRGALGQYCSDDGACAWLIILWNATCSEGEQHPVLVNTDRSASNHIVQCIGTLPGVGSALAFADFDRVDVTIRAASVVGIAIPEHTDAIGIAHFKLDGAVAALDSMRARIIAQAKVQ